MVLANVVKFSENEMTFFAGSTNTDVSMQLIAERFSVPLLLVTMGKLESKPVLTAGSTLIQHVQLTVSTPPVREMLLSPGYYGNWHSTVYQKTNHNSQLTTHNSSDNRTIMRGSGHHGERCQDFPAIPPPVGRTIRLISNHFAGKITKN